MTGIGSQKDILRKKLVGCGPKVQISVAAFLDSIDLKAGSVGVYAALKDEPILMDLPSSLELSWPKIIDQEKALMEFYEAQSFAQSSLGFQEPSEGRRVLKTDLSLIFVPGQAFDYRGRRLGRGRGFYDRYLEDCTALKVGVCSDSRFLFEPIPVEKTDVPVDWVITETKIYKVNVA